METSKSPKTVDVKDCSRLVLVQTQPWSDRQAFQEHGLVKGVQVKKNGESKRGNINEMRLLHGNHGGGRGTRKEAQCRRCLSWRRMRM